MEREELIYKYLHTTLSPYEKDQFDTLLENDDSFKNEVEFLKNLKIVSGVEDRNELRKNMNDFEAKITSKETKVVPLFNYKKLLVAASILLVIAIGGISLFNPFALDTNVLYANNFEPYKNVVAPIVRGEQDNNEETMAFTSYENKEYEVSTVQFGKLYEATKRPYFLLYQANSFLAIGNTAKAIPLLEQHISFDDQLAERGKWYLSLAYLKENRKKESIALLEELIAKGNFKKGAAEQLLQKLK